MLALQFARLGWEPTAPFVVGTTWRLDEELAARHVPVTLTPGHGYDGQWFLGLAYDPLLGERLADGFDMPRYRAGRPLQAVAGWLLAGGRSGAIPLGLLAVGPLAVALGCAACGRLLAAGGWSPWWGLGFALGPGVGVGVMFATAEPLGLALAVVGLSFVLDGRLLAGGLGFAGAALTKETLLAFAVAAAAWLAFRAGRPLRARAAPLAMPLTVLIPLLLMGADAPINVVGHAWAPFISPMGEPFRARTKSDNTLALWFNQADRNRDGMLTREEMVADADRFFAKLDRDHNGVIEPEELVAYEWELAPEIQVNSRRKRAPGQPPEPVKSGSEDSDLGSHPQRHGLIDQDLQGGSRYALLNYPEPVAAADADFNRGITMTEFRQAAVERFGLLDRAHTGRLTLVELQALVPPPPKKGRRALRSDKSPDPRIGQPLPPGE